MNLSAVAVFVALLGVGHNVDLEVVAQIESGGDPKAVSSAGARGLFQIMPATWKEFAKRGERWRDPEDNRAVADRYLEWIAETLKGWGDEGWANASHILAAYNGGIGRFKRCGFAVERMPGQTRDYVEKYWKGWAERQVVRESANQGVRKSGKAKKGESTQKKMESTEERD